MAKQFAKPQRYNQTWWPKQLVARGSLFFGVWGSLLFLTKCLCVCVASTMFQRLFLLLKDQSSDRQHQLGWWMPSTFFEIIWLWDDWMIREVLTGRFSGMSKQWNFETKNAHHLGWWSIVCLAKENLIWLVSKFMKQLNHYMKHMGLHMGIDLQSSVNSSKKMMSRQYGLVKY